MLNGKALRQILDKMMKSPVAQEARVQIRLPDGQHFDITSLQLMENKILGARETHRLVLTVKSETDLLGYNNNGVFFTVELKYTKTNKITFSPHQIAFHIKHPTNTFILVLDASCKSPKLYEGSRIRDLAAGGLVHKPMLQGFPDIKNFLELLGA